MASLRQAMKTAGRRNPNRWATVLCTPNLWRGRSEPLLDHVGWEARKTPATGEVFFLDFYLYRTYQDLARHAFRVAETYMVVFSKQCTRSLLKT